jgi:phenylacetate-CoA ligase
MGLYNLILEKILLPVGDGIFGSQYIKNINFLRALIQEDEETLVKYQETQLSRILQHALQYSPYYSSIGLTQNSNATELLKNFPVLTKDIIRERGQSLLTTNKTTQLIKNQTSGSTGKQTTVFVTKKEQSFYRAAQTLWWEWAGFKIGTPMVQTGLATTRSFEKKLKDLFLRTNYLFAFKVNDDQAEKAFLWAKDKNAFLGGYASSLFLLAEKAEQLQVDCKFTSAVSWGDKLFDHYRAKVERVFNCKVHETYGAGEGIMIAAQKDLPWMYIMTPCVFLEIVDDEGNEVQDGEMGHVLVTSLTAFTMPLIRYKIGDLAIKLPREQYPATRMLQLPILQKVIGRDTDIVVTPSGNKLVVHSFTGIFEYFPEIKQFCIVQSDLNGIKIKYIPGVGCNSDVIETIKRQLASLINEKFDLAFEIVDGIPPTASGKPQIIISNLEKNKIT